MKDKFAECCYCEAKIPILREKVVEIPDKKAEEKKKWKRLQKKIKASKKVDWQEWKENLEKDAKNHNKWMFIKIAFLFFVILLPFLLYFYFQK